MLELYILEYIISLLEFVKASNSIGCNLSSIWINYTAKIIIQFNNNKFQLENEDSSINLYVNVLL